MGRVLVVDIERDPAGKGDDSYNTHGTPVRPPASDIARISVHTTKNKILSFGYYEMICAIPSCVKLLRLRTRLKNLHYGFHNLQYSAHTLVSLQKLQ